MTAPGTASGSPRTRAGEAGGREDRLGVHGLAARQLEHLRKLPADLNPTELADTSPPSQIDVFTAGINWADVIVPGGSRSSINAW